jgi:RimJ/RimL family protein N-acetyltransferase
MAVKTSGLKAPGSIFEELRSERLLLRPYRLEDAPALYEAIAESREHLRPWESFANAFQTVEETQNWILRQREHWQVYDWFYIGMWSQIQEHYLGGLWLGPLGLNGWQIPAFELAYWLRVSALGQGYATEGVRLLMDYAIEVLGAQRLELTIDARNERSLALARRLGFKEEGRLRRLALEREGVLVDDITLSFVPDHPVMTPAA